MSTKGFLLLMVTVVVIGGAIGGAFSGGLALGRSQNDDADHATALLQRFGGGQASPGGATSGGFAGGGFAGGGAPGGATSNGQGTSSAGETETGQTAPPGFGGRGGGFGGLGGAGGGFSPNILDGTVGAVDGNILTITTDAGETLVTLGDDSTIQNFATGAAEDLSNGDPVMVIGTGDPVDAALVIVNPPDGGGLFGGGGFGGRGGFGGGATSRVILIGTIGSVDGNAFTVVTETGETQAVLGDGSTIQVYEIVAASDLSTGDRVRVIVSGDIESGEPVEAVSVIVNPPEGGGIFGGRGAGGGGFGGRPRGQ